MLSIMSHHRYQTIPSEREIKAEKLRVSRIAKREHSSRRTVMKPSACIKVGEVAEGPSLERDPVPMKSLQPVVDRRDHSLDKILASASPSAVVSQMAEDES